MAVTRLPRTPTAIESMLPEIARVVQHIDKVKRLRGEQEQRRALRSAAALGGTPEEISARAMGSFQDLRSAAQPTGALGRVFGVFDPRGSKFSQAPTGPEQFVDQQTLGRAFEDPAIRQTRELNLQTAQTRAKFEEERIRTQIEANRALSLQRGLGRRLTVREQQQRAGDMLAFANKTPSNLRIGPNRTQTDILAQFKAWTESPGARWNEIGDEQQQRDWLDYKAIIAGKGDEWEFDATSEEVMKATPGVEPEGMPQPQTDEEIDALPKDTEYWHPTRSPIEGPLIKGDVVSRAAPSKSRVPSPKKGSSRRIPSEQQAIINRRIKRLFPL